jgi:hypothetical protein
VWEVGWGAIVRLNRNEDLSEYLNA